MLVSRQAPQLVDRPVGLRFEGGELVHAHCVVHITIASNSDRLYLTYRALLVSEIETNNCVSGIASLIFEIAPKTTKLREVRGFKLGLS